MVKMDENVAKKVLVEDLREIVWSAGLHIVIPGHRIVMRVDQSLVEIEH